MLVFFNQEINKRILYYIETGLKLPKGIINHIFNNNRVLLTDGISCTRRKSGSTGNGTGTGTGKTGGTNKNPIGSKSRIHL